MLSLTRIFLHNWHRFTTIVLDVQDSMYLTGHNASGKSTILDAMQVVLLADLNGLIKFNSSAQERSERTLDGFVRGKISETRWLRPGKCVGYIVLEFTNTESGNNTLLGCCIEAAESLGQNGERTYFILQEPLDTTLFIREGLARTRSQLKKYMQKEHKGKYYDTIKEYQDDLLIALGNLHRRFFNRFRHALSFTPITNVNRFVEEWLLNERPLQLQNLLQVVSLLEDLQKTTDTVKEKITLLSKISDTQKSYERLKFFQGQFELLHALLQQEETIRIINLLKQKIKETEENLYRAKQEQRDIEAALQGAKNVREETAKQLYGLDVVKELQSLNEKISEKTHAADTLLARKKRLLQDLHNIAAFIQPLQDTTLLVAEEQESLSTLRNVLIQLTGESLFPTELPSLVDAAIEHLRNALERIRGHRIGLDEQVTQLERRIHNLADEISDLKKGGSISYPPQVGVLCDRLEALIGERPTVLCELLEVSNEDWQNAVEAMLGERRFLILVPVGTYEQVLHYIETVKGDAKLHDASVLDLEKAYVERREALPNSLAQEITADNPYLRAYIDSVLGNIITCTSSVLEVRQYRRAITADLVYYNEWTVRVLPSEKFRVWFVGKRARASQIEVRRQEQGQKQQDRSRLIPLRDQARREEGQLDGGLVNPLLLLRQSLDTPPEDAPLRIEISELVAKRDALDMSNARHLQAEVDRLNDVIKHEEKASRDIRDKLLELSSTKTKATDGKHAAENTLRERQQQVAEIQGKYPSVITTAEKLFQEQREERDLTQVISNADKAAKSYITQSDGTMSKLRELGVSYNIMYQFGGIPGNIYSDRYQQELERLEATELPQYEARISQAKQEAEQELREHVLHILRENIEIAKDELRRMNEALKPLVFHGDQYQFRWYPADTMREYHDLIVNAQLIGAGSLFESEFYQNNQETFNEFYEELTHIPKNDAETKAKERLTDYRTYLEYDIEVKRSDGSTSRLSRIAGETSGGETQTPFYVAVAASFVQLYHIMDEGKRRRGRPTIRLVVFDEAFNRMDQDRIGVTLDMLQQFGLQIITATPLERCEYLVPKICTNYVLTRVGEEVLIDEYSNYAAKLEEMYAEGTADTAARS